MLPRRAVGRNLVDVSHDYGRSTWSDDRRCSSFLSPRNIGIHCGRHKISLSCPSASASAKILASYVLLEPPRDIAIRGWTCFVLFRELFLRSAWLKYRLMLHKIPLDFDITPPNLDLPPLLPRRESAPCSNHIHVRNYLGERTTYTCTTSMDLEHFYRLRHIFFNHKQNPSWAVGLSGQWIRKDVL